jgi:hypothetical protein
MSFTKIVQLFSLTTLVLFAFVLNHNRPAPKSNAAVLVADGPQQPPPPPQKPAVSAAFVV